jgi:hypothetical protein
MHQAEAIMALREPLASRRWEVRALSRDAHVDHNRVERSHLHVAAGQQINSSSGPGSTPALIIAAARDAYSLCCC